MTAERPLSSDELAELNSLLSEAYRLLGFDAQIPGTPSQIVQAIDHFLGVARQKKVSEAEANELAFPLGYLLGEQIRQAAGWEWRYVTQSNGFESYGVVRPDKAYVYFAMKDIYDLLLNPEDELNILLLFNMIREQLPGEGNPHYRALG